jgi:hypothetical protein
MSIIDVLQSIAYALTVLPLPQSSGVYGARGNDATCTAQGFFVQFGLAIPCYNASLCYWFLKSITQNMHPDEFRKKAEPYCHIASLLIPFVSAVVYASLDLFKFRGYVCWIQGDTPYALALELLAGAIPAISFVIVLYCLLRIYYSFLAKERLMRRYSTSASGMQWRSRSNSSLNAKKLAARQGLLFGCSFFITYFFSSVNVVFFKGFGGPFEIPMAIFMPLQGFWNFIIYAKPALERIREEYPELTFRIAFRKMIFSPSEVRNRRVGRRNRRSTTRSSPVIAAAIRLVQEEDSKEDEQEYVIDDGRHSHPTSSSSNHQHDLTQSKKDNPASPLDTSIDYSIIANNSDRLNDDSMEESPGILLHDVEDGVIVDGIEHNDSFTLFPTIRECIQEHGEPCEDNEY